MFSKGVKVVFSAFMIQFICFGISLSIGVYNIYFLEYFGEGTAATALIGSLNMGVMLGSGYVYCSGVPNLTFSIFWRSSTVFILFMYSSEMYFWTIACSNRPMASYLMKKFSYRKIALLGASLSTFGLLVVPHAPNVIYLDIFFGVISGLGFCLLYLPSHVLSGLYFDEHLRTLATGLASSSAGLGGFVFPIVTYYLIEEYGWKGSMYILAGMNLHNLVFAALLRPLEDVKGLNAETTLGPSDPAMRQNSTVSLTSIKATSICSLFDTPFIVLCINNILWNTGISVMFVHGPEFFIEVGLSEEQASLALTLLGLGTFFGAIIGGIAGSRKSIIRLLVYTFSNMLIGCFILMLMIPIFHTVIDMYVMNILWGIFLGVVLGLLVAVTTDVVGINSSGDGMGYVIFVSGIGMGAGPYIGGLLRDKYGTYYPSIWFSGITPLVAGLLMFPVLLKQTYGIRKT